MPDLFQQGQQEFDQRRGAPQAPLPLPATGAGVQPPLAQPTGALPSPQEILQSAETGILGEDERLKQALASAEGSPRLALSMLARCGHLKDEDEVRALCTGEVGTSKEAIDLCRLLVKGAGWKDLCICIEKIESPSESVRIIVLRYMTIVAIRGKDPQRMLAIMEEFSQPFLDREGKSPILLACGRLCFD